MNNKILSWVLVLGIAATWFASLSSASETNWTWTWIRMFNNLPIKNNNLSEEQKTQLEEAKVIMEKKKNWETLTPEEQTKLDWLKWSFWNFRWWFKDKEEKWFRPDWRNWFMFDNLSDEEKTSLETMTDQEKKDFFDAKRDEKMQEIQARENVIDKLLAWEILTSDEEELRTIIIQERAERKAKMEERKAQMDEIKTILKKKKSWETLTADEQAKLDTVKKDERWWFNKSHK